MSIDRGKFFLFLYKWLCANYQILPCVNYVIFIINNVTSERAEWYTFVLFNRV